MNHALSIHNSTPSALQKGRSPMPRPPFSLAPLLSGAGSSDSVGAAILDRQRGLTPALARLSPQISGLLAEEQASVDTAQALNNALLWTAHQFNVVRNMANVQMGILADELLERYWFWRFDEFLYVLKEGIAQTWGQTYDRLDPPTVHGWCLAYQELRDQQIEHEAQQRATAFKKAEAAAPRPAVLNSAAYYELRARLEQLSDQELVNGEAYYAAIDDRTQAQEFKLFVASEVANERRAAHWLRQIAKALPDESAKEEASEGAYQRYRANYITQEMAKERAMQVVPADEASATEEAA